MHILIVSQKKLTIQGFVDRARKVHGDKFDYLQVHYLSANIKVKIICPAQGVFEQTPNNQLLQSSATRLRVLNNY